MTPSPGGRSRSSAADRPASFLGVVMHLWMFLAALAFALAGCQTKSAPIATPSAAVALTTVKWPDLEKLLAEHRGKVVLLDVWAEY